MSGSRRDRSSARGPRAGGGRLDGRLRAAVLVLFGLVAVWLSYESGSRALARQWAVERPERALRLRSNEPAALSALAERALEAGDLARATSLARRALTAAPLDPAPLRVLALVAEAEGDLGRARALMTRNAERTWRDTPTHVWLYNHHQQQGEFGPALRHADAVMRNRPDLAPEMIGVLVRVAESPDAVPAIVERLKQEPAWRADFVSRLTAEAPDDATVLALLGGLRDAKSGPTDPEIDGFLRRLINSKAFPEAFRAWRRLAPAAGLHRERLVNGAFAQAGAGPPFGWALGNGVGFSTEIVAGPGRVGDPALRVGYDGYSKGLIAEQLLTLPPGAYTLSGEALGRAPSRLRWTLTCAESERDLVDMAADASGSGRWTAFAADFTTPADGCSGQWLRLSGEPGDRRAELETWFDNLRIRSPLDSSRPGNGVAGSPS